MPVSLFLSIITNNSVIFWTIFASLLFFVNEHDREYQFQNFAKSAEFSESSVPNEIILRFGKPKKNRLNLIPGKLSNVRSISRILPFQFFLKLLASFKTLQIFFRVLEISIFVFSSKIQNLSVFSKSPIMFRVICSTSERSESYPIIGATYSIWRNSIIILDGQRKRKEK